MSNFGWSYPAGCSGPPDEDYAETCPCGKPNWDEETEEWICPEAEGFCSVECEAKYIEECRLDAEGEAKVVEELARDRANYDHWVRDGAKS